MADVLVLNNRKPYFFVEFVDIIFEEVEEHHDVTRLDREGSVLDTTRAFVTAFLWERPDAAVVVGSGFATFWVTLVGRILPSTDVVFFHNDFTYQYYRDFTEDAWLRTQVERLQEGGPLRLCDAVWTLTPYQEDYLREKKGISKPFIRVPHGVDVDEFRPDAEGRDEVREELDLDEDTLAVGVVGTFNRSDKHDIVYGWTVLRALAELDDDDDVVGVLVGSGDAMKYIRERAEELGISDRLILTGHVQHDRLPAYLAALDATVLAKQDHPIDKMTTTMKLPEYLAAGTYPIVDDHAYAQTILDHDVVGVLPFEGIKDEAFPGRLADHLRLLLDDRERLRAGQRHARAVAEERFDYETLQTEMREELESLLA